MVSKLSTVEFIIGNISASGKLAKKMFGEYGIYCAEKMVALVCDDRLFVKPTPGGKAFLNGHSEAPPYPGAKPCFVIPEEKWGESAWLFPINRAHLCSVACGEEKGLEETHLSLWITVPAGLGPLFIAIHRLNIHCRYQRKREREGV